MFQNLIELPAVEPPVLAHEYCSRTTVSAYVVSYFCHHIYIHVPAMFERRMSSILASMLSYKLLGNVRVTTPTPLTASIEKQLSRQLIDLLRSERYMKRIIFFL